MIGPEKLPRVARTVGTCWARRSAMADDVKAEVSRSMELDELKKMKDTVTSALPGSSPRSRAAPATSRNPAEATSTVHRHCARHQQLPRWKPPAGLPAPGKKLARQDRRHAQLLILGRPACGPRALSVARVARFPAPETD